jgi:hypothetical protein
MASAAPAPPAALELIHNEKDAISFVAGPPRRFRERVGALRRGKQLHVDRGIDTFQAVVDQLR